MKKNTASFSEYLCYRKPTGKFYQEVTKLRITEKHCLTYEVLPSTIFKFVGKGQVGTGSIAGIRFLYEFKKQFGDSLSIWPFDEKDNSKSVFLEIFPTLFYKMADQNTKEGHLISVCNNTLEHFDSDRIVGLKIKSKDESDAIISSAAIRYLSKNPNLWRPTKMNLEAKEYEGWIFGVS